VAVNFVSFEFAVFLAGVYVLHWSCRHTAIRKWLLTIASYVFYAVWNWRFCFLMLFVTVNAFAAGQMLGHGRRGRLRAVLAASIGIDLAVLGFFKYYNFSLSNVAAALADLGVSASLPVMRIILPVGISFYAFHAISYVVDVYRGKVEVEPSFANIALVHQLLPAADCRADRASELHHAADPPRAPVLSGAAGDRVTADAARLHL
jgi:D-alanyl-lipoteichoic acid acyltransferase DltB (MBOAT superfamily)